MPEQKEKIEIENETLKAEITEKLKKVIDPELGIDIVNLNLFNEAKLFTDGYCEISLTLTTITCPFSDVIIEDIKSTLSDMPAITEVAVKLVWYPAWDPSKMSQYAKIALGFE